MEFSKKVEEFIYKEANCFNTLFIIKNKVGDDNVKEYSSIEEAIANLENYPNVYAEKIEKLKSSVKMLNDKTSIKIRNGEIIK